MSLSCCEVFSSLFAKTFFLIFADPRYSYGRGGSGQTFKKMPVGLNYSLGCYKVSLAYFLLLHYYYGWAVAEAMCRAGGCGGYVFLLIENKANSAQLC